MCLCPPRAHHHAILAQLGVRGVHGLPAILVGPAEGVRHERRLARRLALHVDALEEGDDLRGRRGEGGGGRQQGSSNLHQRENLGYDLSAGCDRRAHRLARRASDGAHCAHALRSGYARRRQIVDPLGPAMHGPHVALCCLQSMLTSWNLSRRP